MHVIYRVNQAEYVIQIFVVVPQEYVNIYSTRRPFVHTFYAHPVCKPSVATLFVE